MTTSSDPSVSIEIRSLRAKSDGSGILVSVVIGNGSESETRSLPLTMEQYCDLKPAKGSITAEQFERLEAASRLGAAIRCGENLLSYGSNTAQELTRKIMRHGFSKEEAALAAERLQSIGLVNEREGLSREVEKCLAKRWGARRIQAHLWSKGFSSDALALLPSLLAPVDFAENCAQLIRKQYGSVPSDPDERRRMIAFLCRYGYSLDEIRSACRR